MKKPKIEHIIICGCGAAGGNTFMNLIYAFPDMKYTLIDMDTVEKRNFTAGTQPYTKADLNRPKVQALQRIAQMSKKINVQGFKVKINSVSQLNKLIEDKSKTLIIDCFDNADSRNIFLELKGCNVAHIGFSASLTGTIEWDNSFEKMTHDDKDQEIDVCEMAIARPFIMALTSIAVLSLTKFIVNGKKTTMFFSKDLQLLKFG